LLIDDHPLVRAGLHAVLDAEIDFEVVGEADSGTQASIQARARSPQYALPRLAMKQAGSVDPAYVFGTV
jgi:DNA-binding NarL/FixJ family response regulator